MAEVLWRTMGGGEDVASAGVSAWAGLPAAPHAIETVKQYGASLDGHRARDLTDVDGSFDWVITMTQSQKERVQHLKPAWKDRTVVLSEMVGESGDVHDPAGQDRAAYQAVAEDIYRLLKKLQEKLDRRSSGD